ncbi:MAG: ATP-binding protein [Candidatus Omnitrophota bacterium]
MIKDKFFDRASYLQILEKRISSLKEGYRQNIAIIGEENVGKSSIVFKFLDKFFDPRIITVFLEVRPEPLEGFARRFIGALLYNFLSNSGIPLKEDVTYLIEKSSKYIPKTTAKINSLLGALSRRKKVNIFTDIFSLPESIHQETGKFTVLFLDEFHNLENVGFSNLYREWSKLLILQKNTLYVIISSMIFKTRLILSKQLSLLFGNFEIVSVEPFDIYSSNRYLQRRLPHFDPQGGLQGGLQDFIINFTGGYPLYLELVCDAMLKRPEGPALADISADLAGILEGLLFNTSGILNQRFSNYIKRFLDLPAADDYISILYLISSGNNRIKDIIHILRKQKKELNLKINYLLQLDAITRSGDFFKVSDRLFAYWMRFVYQEKMRSLTFDARNQKEKFRDSITELIRDFLKQTQKPLANRVYELMQLFENDLMQIERKKIRLNHFREIKPLAFKHRFLKEGLLGRCSEALWIMAIKPDALTEQDIADFAKECKRYHHKSQRKIMVTLKEVDANTRLRALEEKVWTWDLTSLNQILDLFSQPRVIA